MESPLATLLYAPLPNCRRKTETDSLALAKSLRAQNLRRPYAVSPNGVKEAQLPKLKYIPIHPGRGVSRISLAESRRRTRRGFGTARALSRGQPRRLAQQR